ncbi:MAG: ABC-type transporter, periplasmic subunit, partial [Gemmatimonadetes bacterium]|nr:ABC-type transporter, periplasmic subunit [Gemmatimonadota bacterium]
MHRATLLLTLVVAVGACRSIPADCPRCDTIVIAAISEPEHLLPPLVWESVGRDIMDLTFERLAVLENGRPPMDPAAYRPGLASRWDRVDSVTWRFRLRPAARWQDGTPVTPGDVVFAFTAFQDSTLDSPARGSLSGIRAEAESDTTVLIRFSHAYPEQLYDATWHVRVIPAHVWENRPRPEWAADTSMAALVGSGPYRVVRWDRGQSLTLERAEGSPARIGRVVWRFADGPEAAANLVLGHEADALETIPDPARRPQFASDTSLALRSYPSAVYGFLGFQLAGRGPLTDPRVRQALAKALDREQLAAAVFGAGTAVPAGPLSAIVWLWDGRPAAPLDTVGASALLDAAGWRRASDGLRARNGRPLTVDILVPATSVTRRNLAVAIQERWKRIGMTVSVSAVDFPVFQERLGRGQFDSYIGAWLDEPSPRSLAEQWTRQGWGTQNYGRYANPAFDRLFEQALAAPTPDAARTAWQAAMGVMAADQPAIFLYTLTNTAVISRRVAGVT